MHIFACHVFTDKFVKKWAGIPPSATNALIHSKVGMNIKSISELYTETQRVSHTRTILQLIVQQNQSRQKGIKAVAEVE